MIFRSNTNISRQIGIVTCIALLFVFTVFIGLVWMLAGERLSIYSLYYLSMYTVAVAVVILLGIRWLVKRFIKSPLNELTVGLKRAEAGDFLHRVQISSKNEIGELAQNFNRLMKRFTDLMATQLDTEEQLNQTQAELTLKSEIARQAEVIRKTNEELQSRIKYLSLLYDIGNSINSIIEPEQLYNSLVRIISDQLGFQEFAILILDAETEMLEVRASHGFPEEAKIAEVKFHLGEGVSGIVAQTGKRQLIRDTAKDPRYLHYKGQLEKDGSFLCLPLKVKGSVLGVFNLFRPKRNAFSAHEIRLLSAIANQAAIAIENAQLFNNTMQLSVTDELTGVSNRRHFKNMLELEKKRSARFGKPMSILMIDVDNFKKYNDTYGHLEGDKVLKQVSHLLSHNIREIDLIARFGGEEFIVLLTNATAREAFLIGEKLREKVEQEPFKGEEALPGGKLTVSIGCACCPDDTADPDELENQADMALYDAKRSGKNKVIRYTPPAQKTEKSVGLN